MSLQPIDELLPKLQEIIKLFQSVQEPKAKAYLDFEKNVVFEADSYSVLTKGLAALLVQGLSSQPIVKEKGSRG
uniref:Uncharacterized protein n=1 Tax=Salix viminalis TaxID=40686 RepID=A0A6N2LTK2_SALVM